MRSEIFASAENTLLQNCIRNGLTICKLDSSVGAHQMKVTEMPDQLQRKSSELPSRAPLDYVEISPWSEKTPVDELDFDETDLTLLSIAFIIVLICVAIWFGV